MASKTVKEVLATEFSEDFVQKMKNRMVTSHYKYGSVRDAMLVKRLNVNDTIQTRLAKYNETGNSEWLIDIANIAMMAFMVPNHPKANFRATDSHESPGIQYGETK